ncbi:MAG TPA: hypothetical protein VFG64_08330 [Dongiaceae bacterium]|jgi:hypothetical protein|nr:hypothetical protein [Dongiaceae bacterium]
MGYVQTFDTDSLRPETLANSAIIRFFDAWNGGLMAPGLSAVAIVGDTSGNDYRAEMVAELLKVQAGPTVIAPAGTAEFIDWLNTP